CIGVDLASGAFVRAHHPGGGSPLRPYDVATCRLGQSDVPDWSRPELVTLAAPPRRAGRLRRRKAERYLRPLLHPPRPPLLGFGASAVPYWTLEGNQPSVTLIEPARLGVVREGRAARSSAMAQPKAIKASPRLRSTPLQKALTSASTASGFWDSKSRAGGGLPSPLTMKVRSSIRPSAPKRLTRRRPHARSSPLA